jgi:hypothetical protein
MRLSLWWFHVAPLMLLNTAPSSIRNAIPSQLAVPLLFSVTPLNNGSLLSAIPPFASVVPVPLSVPPDHVISPLTVNVLLFVSVPLLSSSVVVELVPFSVIVPLPLIFRSPNVAAPAIVNGPVAKAIGAPVSRLAMLWFVLARLPMVIVEVKVLAIQTLFVDVGTTPVLQLPAVVH